MTTTKYYMVNGQRVAMNKGGTITHLHSDHLGGAVLETNDGGTITTDQKYYVAACSERSRMGQAAR